MRVLLDESLPEELRHELVGHDVFAVRELTAGQNLQYQQNLRNLPLAVIVVIAKSNRIQDVRPLMPRLLETLATLAPRTLVRVGP